MARNPGIRMLPGRGLCLALALIAAMATNLWAQVPKKPANVPAVAPRKVVGGGRMRESADAATEEDVSENVFLSADRQTLQKLADSKKLLAEGRFSEAVRYLGDILEGPEDFFFQPEKNSPVHRSLKAETRRLIGRMPTAGRELYELQYGARARQMLGNSLKTGDAASLAEVSRQFFHTRSGLQATFLLGLYQFDHGQPLAAALTLERLREAGPGAEELEPDLSLTTAACWLRAGVAEKARDALIALRRRRPSLRVMVAGREVPIFTDDAQALDWFAGLIGPASSANSAETDHWLMFRGNAARNAAATGGAPLLNLRWRVALTDDPLFQAATDQYEQQWAEHGAPLIPALCPLVVGDVLLMRTARNLIAVDFSTGKRLWEVPEEDAPETAAGASAPELQMRQSMLLGGIQQRMRNDMTYGALSSDGSSVFAIEDLGLGVGPGGNMVFRLGGGRVLGRNPALAVATPGQQVSLCNRLAAYDIRTGKLKWHIGGPAGSRALRQAETFFLGPPLPLMGQLYVLGEVKDEVRLMVVDAATGNLLWSQQLAVAEQGVMQDPLRRWAGTSPSYADGVLVCPTSAGAIVGIELSTRSLLWGYQYGRSPRGNRPTMGMSAMAGSLQSSRWIDSGVCLVGGRVLATPHEADFLYCLNLADGALLWKCPRQNDLYVACADREKVVLVGRRTVRALQMPDGSPAWNGQIIELSEGSMPSGRGFVAGNRYFLPLNSAEVIGIDLTAGKIVQTARSRAGDVPGNLIGYRGKVISQGLQGVDAFYQFDAMQTEARRRLAADPNDAEALSLLGEIQLDGGKLSEAIASFRRAYELGGTPHTGELLRDSLLEGLQADFAAYRGRGVELERLIDNPRQQAAYLRLMGDGLWQAGHAMSAFKYYERLIDLDPNTAPLDEIDQTLTVRRDRWLQGRLAMLRKASNGETAARIDAATAARLKTAVADGSIDALERFLNYFGNQPGAEVARSQLVRRLKNAGRLLEAELAASDNVDNSDASSLASPAVAQMSDQRKTKDTGWPIGKVEISTATRSNLPVNPYGRYEIELRGGAAPFFSEGSIRFDDSQHLLAGSDGYGRQQWQLSLATDGQRTNFTYNRTLSHARAQGRLLLVVLGWKLIAVDTLGSGGDGDPRLLWTQDLIGSGVDTANALPFPMLMANLPWQWQHQMAQSRDRASVLGPVTSRYVCFQRSHNLLAVDPRDGQTLWARQDLPPGSDVFGDDQHVFVLSTDREEAMLLRATDGELLGTRKVPRLSGSRRLPNGELEPVFTRLEESCLAALGRRLLLWWPEGDQRVLTLIDPLEGRDVWPGRKFSTSAHTCVVGDQAVGVFEPDGRFVLVGLPDGRTIAELQLEAEPSLIDIALLANGGQYFLITRGSVGAGVRPAPIQPLPGCSFKPIYRGRLYAINEQGRLSWEKPVILENQFLCACQPARLPILTFGSQIYEQQPNGRSRQRLSLLCVDKRNGRIAYKKEYTNKVGLLNVFGDPEKKTVDLAMQDKTITLRFTDKPLPPEPATDGQDADSPNGPGTAHDLWKSMQKTIERLLDRTGRNISGEEEKETPAQ